MGHLQVKDIDDKLYRSLKQRAARERRSVSQEVVLIIERYLSHPEHFLSNPTDQFLQMAGSWLDERSAEDIIADISQNRTDSARFERDNELFD